MKTLAVGFFDGVHLGHQAILSGVDAVLTFAAHPLQVLKPSTAPRLLMSLEDRVAAIRALGISDVRVLEFTRELAAMRAEEFAAAYLEGTIQCGENWRFGAGGRGTPALLKSLGFETRVVPFASYESAPVSSTRIRAALAEGRLRDANAMLGRPYSVAGTHFAGKGLGRTLGFPTINLRPPAGLVQLPRGVYEVRFAGRKALANFGIAPTMGDAAWGEPVWEVHLLEADDLRTDEGGRIELIRFLRPERKFASIEDLQRQITRDCDIIRS